MRIQTVNVVELVDNSIISLISFPDNIEGNKLAEETFTKFCQDNGIQNDDIRDCIENGVAEINNYQVFLVHSL